MLHTLLANYKKLERHILFVIVADFFVQFVNTSFSLILNIYMVKIGYLDYEVAELGSYRFLGVLGIALPLGLFIRTRKIKPLFYAGTLAAPLLYLAVVVCAEHHCAGLLRLSMGLLGIATTSLEIALLPFIIRNAMKETQTEAIALSAAVWAIGTVASGLLIFLLQSLPALFDEKAILQIFCYLGFSSVYFVSRIEVVEVIPVLGKDKLAINDFDWGLIARALVPPFIIAVGAGLTIPFLNLFFYSVHHLDSDRFAILNSFSAILVSFGSVIVPQINRQYGFKVAITMSQSLAIVALVLLATTEFYKNYVLAPYLAAFFFMLRQPLMNMAGPMTSYLVMNYVGKRNYEMASALNTAIWSGSWYVSSQIFRYLRQSGFCYANIFFITAAIYIVGMIGYYLLILDFHKRERQGLIS
jgi:hypothetical protein